MTTSLDDIAVLYSERKSRMAPQLQEMAELTDAYEGTVTVPLPELDRNERVAVANLIAQGLDQTAMRIASTMPDVQFPPTVPGQALAEKRSRVSRAATLGWWGASEMDLKLARRARWLIGYATAPVVVRPDDKLGAPRWWLRSPLSTFPSRGEDPDDMAPSDCIFAYKRSLAWLRRNYPDVVARLSKGPEAGPDTLFEVLEYADADEFVLAALGRPRDPLDTHGALGASMVVELERTPNRAGVPTVIVPGRLTLSRRMGAYNGMIGLYQQQAKLMALEVIAVTRGVFADEWLIARPNETPAIMQVADGRRGVLGMVRGGEIHSTNQQPGYKTDSTMDRLERAQRLTGGVPAEFGGESTTNVRTGRRGDAILSAVVDFPVQEAQKVLARSLQHEVRVAVAIAKAYFGERPKSFYVNAKGAKGRVDYVANRDIPSDANEVTFAHAGSDANALVVGIGQRLGVGTLSKHTARQLDPLIDDPQQEADWIVAEGLESALLAGIAQQVSAGALGPADVAMVADAVRTDRLSLEQAVLAVQKRKQEQQATSGAPGEPTGPVPAGAPEAQPGLGGPGAPPQAGVAPGGIAPTPNEQGLSALLGALKGGAPPPAMVR